MKVRDLFEAAGKTVGSLTIGDKVVAPDGKRRKTWPGDLDCSYNQLTSLEGAPETIRGSFICYSNALKTLKGAPIKVSGRFNCSSNLLTSLEGAPSEIGDNFICRNNPNLKSISGIHTFIKKIGGSFVCENLTHVLGLCLIDGLQNIEHSDADVEEILNAHLGQGRGGMVDACDELIDAGLDKYAQL